MTKRVTEGGIPLNPQESVTKMKKDVTKTGLNENRDDVKTEMTNHTTQEEKSSQNSDMIVLEDSVHIFTNNWGGYKTVEPNDDGFIPFGSLFMDNGIVFSAIASGKDGNKFFQFDRSTGKMTFGDIDNDIIIDIIMASKEYLKEGVVNRIYHNQGDKE